MSSVLPDATTPFGQRVAQRLREETVIWLTTVGADGTPQPNPVWFLWDGETILVYNQTTAKRLQHIARNPHVSLNFNSTDDGDYVVIITGEAQVNPNEKLAHEIPEYAAKYAQSIVELGSIENMAREYPVALRIRPTKVRGS